MKYSILILAILLLSTMENKAQQTINPLPESEFNNIEFGGITMNAIEATEGKIQLIENLMGKPLSIKENGGSIGEKTRKFIYGSKEVIVFDGLSLNQKPSITYIEANSITIKNVSISLGDNIEVFGNEILKNKNEDGSKSIIFLKDEGDCCVVIIEYDNSTNKVSRIQYMVWT